MVRTRTARDALAWCLSESLSPTASWDGYCLRAVRTALRVPAMHGSARAAWLATPEEDRRRTVAPPGAPVFWEVGQHWHVALSAGYGLCWSTDILRRGKIDVVPLVVVNRRWGARSLGWATSLNGLDVPAK